jgi:hypothetical protein
MERKSVSKSKKLRPMKAGIAKERRILLQIRQGGCLEPAERSLQMKTGSIWHASRAIKLHGPTTGDSICQRRILAKFSP